MKTRTLLIGFMILGIMVMACYAQEVRITPIKDTTIAKASDTKIQITEPQPDKITTITLTELKRDKVMLEAKIAKLQAELAVVNEQIKKAQELGIKETIIKPVFGTVNP